MRQPTELSTAILTNPLAQEIIDWVSPIYGNSYVALWIYQSIGSALSRVQEIAEALRTETNPISSVLLLDMWEKEYGIPVNNSMTVEQRQARLLAKLLSRGPCNPHRLAASISAALGGVEVDIEENIAPNTFLVNIRAVVDDIAPAVAVIERKKPAHLIYKIRVATQMVAEADIKAAIALTYGESFDVQAPEYLIRVALQAEAETDVKPASGLMHVEEFNVEVM